MNFNISIDEESYALEVSDKLMQELESVHKEMDDDYDKGLQNEVARIFLWKILSVQHP